MAEIRELVLADDLDCAEGRCDLEVGRFGCDASEGREDPELIGALRDELVGFFKLRTEGRVLLGEFLFILGHVIRFWLSATRYRVGSGRRAGASAGSFAGRARAQ